MIVTAMFPPNLTGTSFYSKNLADSFVDKGHEVIVVTTENKMADPDESYKFKFYRIPSLHIPLKNYFKHLRFCSFYPKSYKSLNRIAKQFQPDVVLLINHYLDIAFPAIFAARKNKIPLYVSVGTQLHSPRPFRNKILNILDRIIVGGLIFPRAKKIISWDTEIERYITTVHSKKNSSKSIIIPFGVNESVRELENYNHDYDREEQILGVGAIVDARDFTFQIRCFKELNKNFPNLKLKIIGHPYINKPHELVRELKMEDMVEFTGEVPHNTVLKELRNSAFHWMMLSGRYVGLGTSTLEAMLMGVPIVSNIPEDLIGERVLKDLENYIFSDGKSIDDIVKKLSIILKDEKLREKIGKGGRQFVQKYMNWDTVVDKYVEMFRETKNQTNQKNTGR